MVKMNTGQWHQIVAADCTAVKTAEMEEEIGGFHKDFAGSQQFPQVSVSHQQQKEEDGDSHLAWKRGLGEGKVQSGQKSRNGKR